MADHPVKNVTNEQVLQALKDLGYTFPPDFDMSGAQNGDFSYRVRQHLSATRQELPDKPWQQDPVSVFERGKLLAKDLTLADKEEDPVQRLTMRIDAYGLPDEQKQQIYDEAWRLSEGGRGYTAQNLTDAASKILGSDPGFVQSVLRGVPGVTSPAPAAPAAPGDMRDQRSGAPAPAPLPGDVRQVDMQAAKAPAQAPADKKTTPPLDTTTKTATDTGVPKIPPLKEGANETEIRDYFKKYYGYASWTLDIPEIRDKIFDIAKNPSGWTKESVQGAISTTQWWQLNGQNAANWLRRRAEDPRTTQQEIKDKYEKFKDLAVSGGIEIPDQRIWSMAEEALKWGWSEDTIQAAIGSEYRFDASKPTATTTELRKTAQDYLVPLSDQTLGVWTKQILTGEKSADEFKQYLTQTAKSIFPHLSAALDRGETVTQYTNVYKEWAAKTLEINPADVDFSQAKWMKALTQVDPKTGEKSVMTVSDFDRLIRTDPTYGYEYTKQAKDEAGRLTTSLFKKMGVTT